MTFFSWKRGVYGLIGCTDYIYIVARVGGQYRRIFILRLVIIIGLTVGRSNTEAENRIFSSTARLKECDNILII